MRQRWSEYYEALLNVDDGRRAQLSEVVRVRVNNDANDELEVSVEDVRKAVKKLKKDKSPGVDGITSEMVKYGEALFGMADESMQGVCVRRESSE